MLSLILSSLFAFLTADAAQADVVRAALLWQSYDLERRGRDAGAAGKEKP